MIALIKCEDSFLIFYPFLYNERSQLFICFFRHAEQGAELWEKRQILETVMKLHA